MIFFSQQKKNKTVCMNLARIYLRYFDDLVIDRRDNKKKKVSNI